MIILTEDPEKSFRKRPRVFRTTRVSHGLATACLLFGKVGIDAETSQHSQSRKPGLRVQLVDVARYEETYSGHRILVTDLRIVNTLATNKQLACRGCGKSSVRDAGAATSGLELVEFLRSRTNKIELPLHVIFMRALPRNACVRSGNSNLGPTTESQVCRR